jgi:hypothetical protein
MPISGIAFLTTILREKVRQHRLFDWFTPYSFLSINYLQYTFHAFHWRNDALSFFLSTIVRRQTTLSRLLSNDKHRLIVNWKGILCHLQVESVPVSIMKLYVLY